MPTHFKSSRWKQDIGLGLANSVQDLADVLSETQVLVDLNKDADTAIHGLSFQKQGDEGWRVVVKASLVSIAVDDEGVEKETVGDYVAFTGGGSFLDCLCKLEQHFLEGDLIFRPDSYGRAISFKNGSTTTKKKPKKDVHGRG